MKKEKNVAEAIGLSVIGVASLFVILFFGAVAYQLAGKLINFIF